MVASYQLSFLVIIHLKTESLKLTTIYLAHNSGSAGFAGLGVVHVSVGRSAGLAGL